MRILLLLFCLIALRPLYAEEMFPKPDWQDSPNPIASPDANPGGEINVFIGQSPKSFNNYLDNSYISAEVFRLMYESLLASDPITLDYEPDLAAKWSISDDKNKFTFWLDQNAKWSDGRPITAEDVKWTYDVVKAPENLTGPFKVSLERFEAPVVVDRFTIRFTAKEVHWENLGAIGSLAILPRHTFEKLNFNKINFDFPVVSGPYKLGNFKEGISVTMLHRGDWWQRQAKRNQGTFNFEVIRYKFFGERDNAYEAFKKGLVDLFPIYAAHRWVNQTKGDKFDKNWIVKQKIYNHKPVGFQGFAMNVRRPPLDDLRIRKAIAHLVDRPKMNSTLMYNQYFLHRSYYEDLYSKEKPCPNQPVAFDKDAARRLLKEAGWKGNPETGLIEKDGRTFKFKVLTRSASSEKFLAIFEEDLRDVGIEMEINKKDWAAWAKDMDEFNFDLTWAAWGAGVRKNPESMWAAKEADRRAGVNVTGFKDDRVDEMIEKQKSIFDIAVRHDIVREIDAIIFETHPYALLWNINYTRLLYWNKFGTPKPVLSKYGDESAAIAYWWSDEDSLADLEDATADKTALPRLPDAIHFDDAFGSGE